MARIIRTDKAQAERGWTPEDDTIIEDERSWATPAEEDGGLTVIFDDSEYDYSYEVYLSTADLAQMGFVPAAGGTDEDDEEEDSITITGRGLTVKLG